MTSQNVDLMTQPGEVVRILPVDPSLPGRTPRLHGDGPDHVRVPAQAATPLGER
ncbi:hypothetical protein ACFU9X_08835 [Streptomyces atratus]|uniref:hypothetical protein n=1 Tax=Streptomyces atratus TaxID=1893 RepID=UPI0036A3A3CE